MKLILLVSLCGLFVSTSASHAGGCGICSEPISTDYYLFEWAEGEKPSLPLWIPEA